MAQEMGEGRWGKRVLMSFRPQFLFFVHLEPDLVLWLAPSLHRRPSKVSSSLTCWATPRWWPLFIWWGGLE